MQITGIYKKIMSRYKDLSFQRRILLNFVALLLICLVILYFILTVSLASIRESELALISKLNNQAVERIESHLRELDNLTKQPLYDDNFIALLLRNAQNKTFQNQEQMLLTLNKIMKSNTYMHSAFFFNTQGVILSQIIGKGSMMAPYQPDDEPWFEQVINLRGGSLITDSIKIPNLYYSDPDSIYAFSVSRAMVDIASGRVVAVLSLFTDIRILREICTSTQTVTGERAMIINDQFRVIYDTDESQISRRLADTDLKYVIRDGRLASGEIQAPDKEQLLTISLPIEQAGWRLIRIIPQRQLNLNTRLLENKIILMLIGFMLLFMLVAIFMSFEVTKPIKKLIQIMNMTEKGDLSVRFKPRHNDEIAQLGNSFNRMLNEINKLIANIYDIERQKRETDLNALQMQINPHFIYNTLESIRMMAKINHDEESSEMIFILSKMLRYSISTKAARVPLRSEITNLRHYMTLQNLRFDNKFILNIQVEPDLEDMLIIKQILQPIVENAVYHALELTDTPGCIWLRAARDSAGVLLEIEDNGVGMAPEVLESLNERINRDDGPEQASRGIGLKNINQRIRLLYGNNCGIQVCSQAGQGTRILVRLPDPEWVPAAENGQTIRNASLDHNREVQRHDPNPSGR